MAETLDDLPALSERELARLQRYLDMNELFTRNIVPSENRRGKPVVGSKHDLMKANIKQMVEDKGSKTANEAALELAIGLVGGPRLQGIRAYHGSPHSFNKFDISKIGTGEGEQTYGHGLYFAENEGVARSYRDVLANRTQAHMYADYYLKMADGDKKKALAGLDKMQDSLRSKIGSSDDPGGIAGLHMSVKSLDDAKELIRSGARTDPGHMYEVNIRAQPEQFLAWDKALAQQPPQAKEFLKARLGEDAALFQNQPLGAVHGTIPQSPKQIEEFREAGIPGLRYLDQGSRRSGTGTSNYVVFDDSLIDILRKYGIAGLAALPTLDQARKEAKEQESSGKPKEK